MSHINWSSIVQQEIVVFRIVESLWIISTSANTFSVAPPLFYYLSFVLFLPLSLCIFLLISWLSYLPRHLNAGLFYIVGLFLCYRCVVYFTIKTHKEFMTPVLTCKLLLNLLHFVFKFHIIGRMLQIVSVLMAQPLTENKLTV